MTFSLITNMHQTYTKVLPSSNATQMQLFSFLLNDSSSSLVTILFFSASMCLKMACIVCDSGSKTRYRDDLRQIQRGRNSDESITIHRYQNTTKRFCYPLFLSLKQFSSLQVLGTMAQSYTFYHCHRLFFRSRRESRLQQLSSN